jgi:hypothetical protein
MDLKGSGWHQGFLLWGADPEAIYNLFDFKNYVTKSCHKYQRNIKMSAAVLTHTHKYNNYMLHDSLT